MKQLYLNPSHIAEVGQTPRGTAKITMASGQAYFTAETYETFVSRLEVVVRAGEFIFVVVDA